MFSPPAIDPTIVKSKADDLRARYDGREMMTSVEVLALLGCTRSSAHFRRQDGNFPIGRKDNGYNIAYPIDNVAGYLIYGRAYNATVPMIPDAQARARRQSDPDAPKIGRPRKKRSIPAP